jgi:hypothetical protein
MKNALLLLALSLATLSAQAGTEKIQIHCFLESSKEVLTVRPVDPGSHYGKFADISSQPATKISGWMSGDEMVFFTLTVGESVGPRNLTQRFPRVALSGPGGVSLTLQILNPATGAPDYISCDLKE